MFASKLLNFLFWLGSWKELNGTYGFISSHFAGLAIIVSQVLQLVLMSSFVYYYLKAYSSILFDLVVEHSVITWWFCPLSWISVMISHDVSSYCYSSNVQFEIRVVSSMWCDFVFFKKSVSWRMSWQKIFVISTAGLCCAYAGFVLQEKWVHYERVFLNRKCNNIVKERKLCR